MTDKREERLLKRVRGLVRQNHDLENQLRELHKQYDELVLKYEKAEELLNKVSPEELNRTKLSTSGHIRFDMATVLFTNIRGFSKLSKYKDTADLMDELDQIFIQFDQIIKDLHIQKIKTIGDAYMCAGGIPSKNITNPVEVVLAAMKMKSFMNTIHREGKLDERVWDLSMGIHTGPVVAATSGKKRISYDIKGDTVNIATRLESSADVGKVTISVSTYDFVREFFDCQLYGKVPVKYKGNLEMYEVKRLKPEFSKDEEGFFPNHQFNIKFLLIQFTDIQEFMLNKLEKELPKYLYYHNVKHTVDVVTQVELIGWGEGVSDEDIILLKTAALFHDAGHILGYDDHESNSIKIAREMLLEYNYSQEQIDIICDIIMATKLPPEPQNILQEIICDADLDYLGRTDFIPVSNTLYKELKEQNKIGSLIEWNKLQIKFLSSHQFFTQTAKSLREVNKQKQIERIKQLVKDEEKEESKK